MRIRIITAFDVSALMLQVSEPRSVPLILVFSLILQDVVSVSIVMSFHQLWLEKQIFQSSLQDGFDGYRMDESMKTLIVYKQFHKRIDMRTECQKKSWLKRCGQHL